MPDWDLLQGLGMAVGLGLLVGMERERSASAIAGVRSFALITLLGALAVLLSREAGHWVVPAALLGIVAATVMGNVMRARTASSPGITTEVAVIVMFIVGALCISGPRDVALVVAGTVYMLLHFKAPMHRFIASLGKTDLTAIAQFVLVSMVIFPLLPDQTFGPYDVLNPRQIWWLVMLVVSLSLLAYVAYKIAGARIGVLLAGVLGGMISSTATTLTQSRQARTSGHPEAACAIIVIASSILYFRVLVLIAVTGPSLLRAGGIPIALIGAVGAVASFIAWRRIKSKRAISAPHENPAQLKMALYFGAVFAAVMLVAAASRDSLNRAGTYLTAVFGGLTDVDAVTLSLTELTKSGGVDADSAWRCIVLATLANTLAKLGIVSVLGRGPLLKQVLPPYGALVTASVLVLLLWPRMAD